MALLLLVAMQASAQPYPFAPLDIQQRAYDEGHEMDLQALDAFGGKRRANGARAPERAAPWTVYGRLGLVNFQNELEPRSSGMQLTWRRTGPRLGGKFYVGIHRRF
jgi:hypothetical protein